jgi:hypothetical protein
MKARLQLFGFFLICQFVHLVASVRLLYDVLRNTPRGRRIVLAYDRLGNAATNGSDKEFISARAYRGTQEGNRGWCVLCRILDWLDPGHCRRSTE